MHNKYDILQDYDETDNEEVEKQWQDFEDAYKETTQEVTLTSVPSKVFGRGLINRIRDGVNSKLRDEQAGFRSGRGTVEQIFILRNIIEQVVEWQSTLYITFMDSVHRESLWKNYGELWNSMQDNPHGTDVIMNVQC